MKKHILIVAGDLPWPVNSGGRNRTWQFAQALKKDYELSLCSLYREAPSEADLKVLRENFTNLWMVSRLKTTPKSLTSPARRLRNAIYGIPWQLNADYDAFFNQQLAQILRRHNFDAVFARYIYQAQYLIDNRHLIKGKIFVDLDDIDPKKYAALLKNAQFKNRYDKFRQNRNQEMFIKYHKNQLKKFNACFVCSKKDEAFVRKQGWSRNTFVVPNSFDIHSGGKAQKEPSQKIILFCGTLNYEANEDAIVWFVKNVWPKILNKEPQAKFFIVGRNATKDIKALINDKDIFLHENVEDVSPFYRKADICAVPIRFGAGTRVKILEAARFHVPVVSTSTGAEGLELTNKKHYLLADDPDSFARACLKLLTEKKLAQELAQNNYQFASGQYDTQVVEKDVQRVFRGLLQTPVQTIAYYSNTLSLGGSEVYLKDVLEHINKEKYKILFFAPQKHPLAEWISEQKSITHIHLDQYIYIPSAEAVGAVSNVISPTSGSQVKLSKKLWKNASPKSLKLLAGTLKDILKLKNMFSSFNIDLIHFNDTGCEPPVIAARLAGAKHIIGTFHVEPAYERGKKSLVHRLTEYCSLRCLHKGIAVSKAVKYAWIKRTRIQDRKISVIYNGIDLKLFPSSENNNGLQEEFGISGDERVICVPARLHPMKGHKILLDSIKNHLKKDEKTKFLFIGDGPLRPQIEEDIQKNELHHKIKLLGFRKDVRKIMAMSDLVVLPSISLEALPYVLIEAMACSKPVVATNFSGIPEIVHDQVTGLLVPRHDPQSLANAIESILNDENKALQMGHEGRKRVEDLFTQERMIRETFKVYDTFLEGTL